MYLDNVANRPTDTEWGVFAAEFDGRILPSNSAELKNLYDFRFEQPSNGLILVECKNYGTSYLNKISNDETFNQ